MITKNMKNLTAMLLQASSTVFGSLVAVDVEGRHRYINGVFNFPPSVMAAYTSDPNAAGISFGTGDTSPTEFDINLEQTITSGIQVTLTSTEGGCDAPGNPWIKYKFTITNSGDENLTIREVGYKQTLKCSTTPGRNDSANYVCLLDRTVLSLPLTIPAGDAAVLVYKLKTNPMPTKVISGVEIVSFEWGSDAQIAAMIDAAHAGTIDLQRDAGWHVGNMRKIHIDAFTGGNDVAHNAQDIDIVISSFDDYNGCGCILQFDFVETLAIPQRINSTGTNRYGGSEMVTVTLPALANALPAWLKEHLIPFDVRASVGNGSSDIETITNNRLALRANIELSGQNIESAPGEGEQIAYYKAPGTLAKRQSYNGGSGYWWTRSPSTRWISEIRCVHANGSIGSFSATSAELMAPFGCI